MDVAPKTSTPAEHAAPAKAAVPATAVALVVGGAACLSASAMFVKLADVNAGTAAFLRCAVALVPLVPMLVHETRRRGPLRRPLHGYALLAGLFLGADYVMWTMSILDVGAAIATVLINVQVLVFPLLARLFSGTPIPSRFLYASPLMLTGIALAAGALESGDRAEHPVRGAVLGVAAGVAYACYLCLMRVTGRHSPEHVASPVCLSTASAAVAAGLISLPTTGLPLSVPVASWGWITALALLGQVAAWLLISKAGPRLAPDTAAALLLLQPVMAIGFGLIVLGEEPSVTQLCGCALVIGTVWIANRTPARRPAATVTDRPPGR
ncbi:DMT family transporter [Streptomyces sp. JJ36]|uniref:DMT family transporter n=1 Tax=Streptomyces sp. JJ36 TaxID=2736645 RepID=UPI001F3D3E74|nr:DMT family transporter [Streptomyces sp. JJ36]